MCITAYALKIFSLGEMTTIIFFSSAIMNLVLNFIVLYIIVSALVWLCLRGMNNKNNQTTEDNEVENSAITQEV